MPFQGQVNLTPAIGLNGDFASTNPRSSVVSPEAGFIAGAGGVNVGTFVWIQSDGKTLLNTGTGAPDGFVPREQQALITTYLAEFGNNIPAGMAVTVMRTGDYRMTMPAGATKGNKVFAVLANGTATAGAAGATVAGAIETTFTVDRTVLAGELTVATA